MKRIILMVAALAAIITGGVAAAAPAMAGTNANPGNGAVVITSQAQADALSGTTINKNVDVPAGVTRPDGSPIWLSYATITGNLSVEGDLTMAADTVAGNVNVSGPNSFLGLTNGSSHFERNLTVQGSSGVYQGGPGTMSFGNWTQWNSGATAGAASEVDGSFTFINNTGGLYSGYPMIVKGNFTYTGNTVTPTLDRSGLTVAGQQVVSG